MTVHQRASSRPCEHPVEVLAAEHRVIMAVLDAMEREAESLQTGQALREDFWLGVADFLANFADGFHHAKEEDLLFPTLAERGIAEEDGPIGVMKQEHVEGRALCRGIHDAATAGDGGALLAASGGFVHLLREHIHKEETVLFELAKRILNAETTNALQEAFDQVKQETLSDTTRNKYVQLATELCEQAGVVCDDL
ncbi:MAG: hemerythrin domain-containing protein [Planctomycetota bacterium]